MKFKVLGIVVVMTMSIFAGCSKSTPSEQQKPTVSKVQGYKKGTYKAEGTVDERGWKPFIEITVGDDGKIAKVVYDEVDKDGKNKSQNETYAASMKEKTKITPKEAYDKLTATLLETQDTSKTDAVTGATHATDNFKVLALKALETAK